ncbi:MAG TPA: MYXO-CTERM sorting domain-containing protein [Myxococcota bacterium]
MFVPFDFFATVPRNLDFGLVRAGGADCGHPVDGRLVGPDDVEHHVTWSFSADGTVEDVTSDVPAPGLAPGNWQLFFSGGCAFVEDPDADNNGDGFPDGVREARVGNFTVVDRVDAPVDGAVRATRIDRVGGEAPGSQSPCGGAWHHWPTTFTTVAIDEADVERVAVLEIGGEPYRVTDGAKEVVAADYAGDDDLVAVDFAGNRADVVIESVEGCGCSEHDAPSFVVGLAALFLTRRRRRA